MRRFKFAGIVLGALLASVSLLIAGVVWAYLTEYGPRRIVVAAVVAGAGLLAGLLGYLLVSRSCRTGRCLALVALVVVLLLAPLGSMVYPRKVTYARFGLTVYGLIPVPVLDVTVGPHGGLRFRDKSHYNIALEELNRLLTPEVEVVVIGIGWDSAARVGPAIAALEGPEVHILPPPEAFARYNQAISVGRVAVLIAHST